MNIFKKCCYVFFLSAILFLLLNGCSFYLDANYISYEDLRDQEVLNEDYEINYQSRDSDIAVIGIHGGDIEPGTSEVVEDLANQMELSYYLFEGIKPMSNRDLHLSSEYFDEQIGRSMVQNSMSTLSIHGFHGEESIIYIGGRNEEYKEAIRYSLQDRGFQVESAPNVIGGMSKKNIVNDNQLEMGVQLELTAGLRKSFFKDHDWSRNNRHNTTEVFGELIDSLEEATNYYRKMT